LSSSKIRNKTGVALYHSEVGVGISGAAILAVNIVGSVIYYVGVHKVQVYLLYPNATSLVCGPVIINDRRFERDR
jgi:hypothetical protein